MPATISKARSSSVIFILCAMLLMMVGCGSSVKSSYVSGFTPAAGTRIRLGAITDSAPIERRGKKKDFDIRNELRNQLENQLSKAGLLATGTTTDPSVQLMVDITNYNPGDAFKRWLAPGCGQTKLELECRHKKQLLLLPLPRKTFLFRCLPHQLIMESWT